MKDLWIDGHFIEVTDEVYAAYVKGQRKIDYFEKDLKTERVIKEKDGSITNLGEKYGRDCPKSRRFS